ncbi:glycosyltransferase family 4 protein [Aeromonas veronii]
MDAVYYDVTRLLARHSASTPTGIDRVDIRYANHYLNKDVEKRYVYQKNATFYFLPIKTASILITLLYEKWISNRIDAQGERKLSTIYKSTIGDTRNEKAKPSYLKKLTSGFTQGQFKAVDGYLMDLLSKDRDKNGYYINTSHHGVGHSDAYYVFKCLGKLKIIFYLHDLIPIDYPEYVRVGDDKNHFTRVSAMANFSDAILVNSSYTKERFVSFCHEKKYRVPPIHIAYIGVEESFITLLQKSNKKNSDDRDDRILISTNYFVTVSTIEPRKNHIMLLQVWRNMVERKVENIPKLIILGKRGWNVDSVIDFLERSPSIKPYVIELSGVSDTQLVDILRGARAMLFPSFVEGWGMPLVEAMALKLPVLCSDIPAFHESGQMLATYIDPIDAIHWQAEIIKISKDDKYRDELKKTTDNFILPTWLDSFIQVDEFISSIEFNGRFNNPANKKAITSTFKMAHEISITKNIPVGTYKEEQKDIRFRRKVQKFKKDPQKFFLDSKFWLFQHIGKKLERY